jgi:hypothetical protein
MNKIFIFIILGLIIIAGGIYIFGGKYSITKAGFFSGIIGEIIQKVTIENINAEHLDKNRNFIENIYPLVNSRDYSYTNIPNTHYIRVTFKENLNSNNDITIYAKSNSSASVQVYEKDSNELLADFGTITGDNMYKVYLTNLTGKQDTFDLLIMGDENSSVDFDYIVDPYASSAFVDGSASGSIGTTAATATTVATLSTAFPAGNNLVFAALQVMSDDTGNENVTLLNLNRVGSSTPLAKNEYAIPTGVANTNNNYFIMGNDSGAGASPSYNVTAYSNTTSVNIEGKIVALSGITYWQFNDSGNITLTKSQTSLATLPTNFPAGTNVIIAAVQVKNGITAQNITGNSIRIMNGATVLSSNQFNLSLGPGIPTDIQDIVLLAVEQNNSVNPIYNVTMNASQTAIAEVKVMAFRVNAVTFVNNSGSSALQTRWTNISNVSTTYVAGSEVVVIGAVQIDDSTTTTETMPVNGLNLTENGVSKANVSKNELIMSAFNAWPSPGKGITYTLIWRNASVTANPHYNITAVASATGLNAEAKILVMQIAVPDIVVPTYSLVQTNNTEVGQATNFSIYVNDDNATQPNGQYVFSTNNTGYWVNDTPVNFTATPQWANTTETLNLTSNNLVSYRWFFNDSSGNENNTGVYNVTTTDTTLPTYNNSQTNNTNIGQATNFSLYVNDNSALNPNGQYVFSTNNTGYWVNETPVNFTTTPQWANTTETLNTTGSVLVSYRWFFNDSAGNENNTGVYNVTTVADTCTYSSGNWAVNCNDNCTISSNVNLGGNNLTLTNAGTFWLSANISNYNRIVISTSCKVVIGGGSKFT